MDKQTLQLPHVIWRKRNNLQWLEAAVIEEAWIKWTKGPDLFDLFASVKCLSEEVDSIDFAVALSTKDDSSFVSKNDDDDDDINDDDDDSEDYDDHT